MTMDYKDYGKLSNAIMKGAIILFAVLLPIIPLRAFLLDKAHPLYFLIGSTILGIIIGCYLAHLYKRFVQTSLTMNSIEALKMKMKSFMICAVIFLGMFANSYFFIDKDNFYKSISIPGYLYLISALITIAIILFVRTKTIILEDVNEKR